jgi:hypothetical protein
MASIPHQSPKKVSAGILVNHQGGVALDIMVLAELVVGLTVHLGHDDILSPDLLGRLLELGFYNVMQPSKEVRKLEFASCRSCASVPQSQLI